MKNNTRFEVDSHVYFVDQGGSLVCTLSSSTQRGLYNEMQRHCRKYEGSAEVVTFEPIIEITSQPLSQKGSYVRRPKKITNSYAPKDLNKYYEKMEFKKAAQPRPKRKSVRPRSGGHPSGLSGEHDVVLDAIMSECLHQETDRT